MKALLVISSEDGLAALPWARRAVDAIGGSLAVVCPSKDPSDRLQTVSEAAADAPACVVAALAAVTTDDKPLAPVYDCRAGSIRRAVLKAARELDADLLIVPADVVESGGESNAIAIDLARVAPYDVLVFDPGGFTGPPHRTLVPQVDGGGAHAITFAARHFADSDHPAVAMPDPAAAARSKRVYQKAAGRLKQPERVRPEDPHDDLSLDDALTRELHDGELVLVDADEASRVPRLLARLAAMRRARPDINFAIGITRAEFVAGPGRIERALERFRLYAPALDREQRRDLYDLLERGAGLSTDFVVMITLSAAIATLGLIQSSASVVIGAMLVAPLMTPIVAMGMALTQRNVSLFRAGSRSTVVGVLGALAVSMLLALLSPWGDLSTEVAARGGPNIFDLGIALLSGMAASFALARPGLAGTLVGVAIAVALVPPLAAVGIATVKAEFGVAGGAALLFCTNLLAIVLGSALVFRLFGIHRSQRNEPTPPWVRTTLIFVSVGLLVTTIVLISNLIDQSAEGVHRPYSRPLSPTLRDAIRDRIARVDGVEIITMAESDIEHGFGIELVLASMETIDAALVAELRAMIEQKVGSNKPVRILTLRLMGLGD